ncbi:MULTISPECIES: SDR family NAD(P)-dependent oxidoreductase [Limosilactobacillus]|uniref:SDR family NAD(P)-dependent oxidoreductase n=1 Tax=Limosilactobacillus TaxID=2742598 RepID=UPI000BEEE803|nr:MULTISPECIES: SDR family oxidoreductase [Limosilactobacillus]PEG78799.1 short-chain dehydrogenase [Lactobacillus sp. UMNPBX18]PEG89188.1 short-chain dehydrogenase [Lactobacillus sp. UMNPBX13]PEG95039.1 short-chain dehydrogenase [Lactobacillus sp. UMNPBX10]PEH00284.1 short-chain dehydrogenase [Lactobacillus sp. UMNPBX7]MCC4482808.1 SDR family oxidoreductase [Limosilactobacillus reuteri]
MQTVVISGGTSGIGLATADIFLKNGWNTVLIGRDTEKGMQVKQQLGETYSPTQVAFIQADISKSSEVEHAKQITLNKFKTVDAIINNAGIVIHGEVHETSEEDWDKIFDVDVKGTFLVSKAFLPTMIEQDHGSIVNISSVSGMAGDRAMVAYNAAKGAIINMTRAMAIDYGKNNIRVNVVAPGPTNTPLFHQDKQKFAKNSPLNRIVEPEEVAAAIYFVASPAASAITGEVIPVTAGFEISTGQPM